jgi:hypothetical protein
VLHNPAQPSSSNNCTVTSANSSKQGDEPDVDDMEQSLHVPAENVENDVPAPPSSYVRSLTPDPQWWKGRVPG